MDLIDKFFKHVEVSPWPDNTPKEIVLKKAQEAFDKLPNNITKNKIFFRNCGQSGSGKTTQLLVATQELCKHIKIVPVVIAVRNFAIYHPQYNELLNMFGKAEIRERTNGFALKCLFAFTCLCLKEGFSIIYDTTILDKTFEQYMLEVLKQNEYKVIYQILSVNKQQSNMFIYNREVLDKNNFEFGRKIFQKSKDYFYTSLRTGLKFIMKNDNSSRAIVWSAYDKKPIYDGLITNCYEAFKTTRTKLQKTIFSSTEMAKSKIDYLLNNF